MTTNTLVWPGDEIVRRAHTVLEAQRKELTPLLLSYLSAAFYAAFIAAACIAEYKSSGIGFHSAFPVKSDGTTLAGELMSLRLPIIFCLLAGDVVLSAISKRFKAALDGLVQTVGLGAILLVLVGVGAFMFSATFLTLGSEAGQGFAGHLVGIALAVASSATFTLSFLASHAMMGRLGEALPIIARGLDERARIAAGDGLLRRLEEHRNRGDVLHGAITEMERPDALRHRAANEAGVIVGMVASEFHDLAATRRMRGDAELEPQDTSEAPDLPLEEYERRATELQKYTADYFFDLLKQKEA